MTSPDASVEAALAHAVADELVLLTGALAALMDDLGGDIDILRRHMTGLQAIDRISQTQLALADVLRAAGPIEARLSRVPLDTLVDRLRAGTAMRSAA